MRAFLSITMGDGMSCWYVTDPSLPDNPIVFASQGFLDITGYRMDQVDQVLDELRNQLAAKEAELEELERSISDKHPD